MCGTMEIIDAQIHDVHPAAWSEGLCAQDALAASVELALTALDAVGVTAAVVSAKLDVVRAYLDRDPTRFGGLPFASPRLPIDGTVDDFVAEMSSTPGIVGIRLIIGYPPDGSNAELFRNGSFEPYFAAAERHRLPVFVLMHGHLRELHAVLHAHPDLILIVDHLGLPHPPWSSGPQLFGDLPDVLELAQFPNVAVKLTGAPHLSSRRYPFDDLWPHLHAIIDAFGVDRLMWGSDFTRCRDHHSYREAIDYLAFTDQVSRSDKEALFSGSIRRWLKWPTDAPPALTA